METKICSKCGIEKSLDDYFDNRFVKSGKTSKCKSCILLETKNYRRKNKDIIKEKDKNRNSLYRIQNKESIVIKNKIYYEANKDIIKTKAALYFQKNKTTYKSRLKKARESCSDFYIKDKLIYAGFKSSYITSEIIELKRKQIIMHRLKLKLNNYETSKQ